MSQVTTQESSYRDATPSARAQLDDQIRAIMHTLAYHYLPLVPSIGKVKHVFIPLEACAVLPYGWAGSGAGGEVPLGEALLRRLAANKATMLQSPPNHVALWGVLARMPREVLTRHAAALTTFSYAALLVNADWDAKGSAEVLQRCAECGHAHTPLLHHLTGVVARGKPDLERVTGVLTSLSQLRATCRHVPDRRHLRALGRMAAECLHKEHYKAVVEAPAAAAAAAAKEGSKKQDAGEGSSGKKEAASGDSGSSKKDEGPVTHGPVVLMSGDNIDLVMQTLGLGLGSTADAAAGDVGGLAAAAAGGGSDAAAAGFAPSDGFLHNLRALVVSDLMRKGFTAHHSEAAWDDTHAAALQVGSYLLCSF